MLDKSIPYKDIIMKADRRAVKFAPEPIMPEGFSIRLFQDSDENHWARIETSVLEFDKEEDAKSYFYKTFFPHLDELKKRCVFAVNPDGLPVGTATAWFEGNQALMHWVAVCPEYQGLGLGKAVALKVMNLLAQIGPPGNVALHTQTWSHVAVKLYHQLGFHMLKSGDPAWPKYNIDFDETIEVFKGVMDAEVIQALVDNAR